MSIAQYFVIMASVATVLNLLGLILGFFFVLPYKLKSIEERLTRIEDNHLTHIDASLRNLGERVANLEGKLETLN